jgi:hypothetical protein
MAKSSLSPANRPALTAAGMDDVSWVEKATALPVAAAAVSHSRRLRLIAYMRTSFQAEPQMDCAA